MGMVCTLKKFKITKEHMWMFDVDYETLNSGCS